MYMLVQYMLVQYMLVQYMLVQYIHVHVHTMDCNATDSTVYSTKFM